MYLSPYPQAQGQGLGPGATPGPGLGPVPATHAGNQSHREGYSQSHPSLGTQSPARSVSPTRLSGTDPPVLALYNIGTQLLMQNNEPLFLRSMPYFPVTLACQLVTFLCPNSQLKSESFRLRIENFLQWAATHLYKKLRHTLLIRTKKK